MKRRPPSQATLDDYRDDYRRYQEELMLRLQPVTTETPPQPKAAQSPWIAIKARQHAQAAAAPRWLH
jgi:hypothetical protein